MEQRNKHTLSAKKRFEMLQVAYLNAVIGVGAQLVHAEAPRAYAAYKRLEKSIDMTLRHALRKKIRDGDGETSSPGA